jgi:RNA polymerase sigma-70 factor (ECF subfamily)
MEDTPGREDRLSAALESTLTRFRAMVRSIGARHRLDASDVEEVMQEVRIRLWRACRTSERIDQLGTSYVYRTATSAALDLLRRRPRTTAGYDEVQARASVLEAPGRDPLADVEGEEIVAHVGAAMETLALSRRTVVRLYVAGYDREEIARMLGWSEARTRNLLYRGLADLRAQLRTLGIGPEGAR